MSPLLACRWCEFAPAHTQLRLVVQVYVTVYLAILVVGLTGFWIGTFLVAMWKGGDDSPPDGLRRIRQGRAIGRRSLGEVRLVSRP